MSTSSVCRRRPRRTTRPGLRQSNPSTRPSWRSTCCWRAASLNCTASWSRPPSAPAPEALQPRLLGLPQGALAPIVRQSGLLERGQPRLHPLGHERLLRPGRQDRQPAGHRRRRLAPRRRLERGQAPPRAPLISGRPDSTPQPCSPRV